MKTISHKNNESFKVKQWFLLFLLLAALTYIIQNSEDFNHLLSIFPLALFKKEENDATFTSRYHQLCIESGSSRPVNRIKNDDYRIELLPNSRNLFALRSSHTVEWEKIEKRSTRIFQLSKIYRQKVKAQMESILGENFSNLQEKEQDIIFKLHALLGDALAVNETKTYVCDKAVSLSISKIIVDHYYNNTKIPPMIGVTTKYGTDESYHHYMQQYQFNNGHFLDSHAFLLIAHPQDLEKILQLEQLNIDGMTARPLAIKQQAVALLEKLDPQVCDLWSNDSKPFSNPRSSHSVIGHLKINPQYLYRLQFLHSQELELSKKVKKILDFFVRNHQKLWDFFIKKQTITDIASL